MQLLFMPSSGTAGKEKVFDTNFQNHYPSVNGNMLWKEVAPYVRQATQKFILPFLGQPLYDALAVNYLDDTLSDEQKELVELLQDAIANFTVAMALPRKKTIVASMGAVENTATDNSTSTSLWGYKSTLFTAYQDAGSFLDSAIEKLEFYSRGNNIFWDVWKDSPAYNSGATDFFRTTSEFMEYHPINRSHRTFLAMRPIINEQSGAIRAVLCDALYNDLVAKKYDANLSDAYKKLLDHVRRVVAKQTVANAVDSIPVLPETDGFRIITAVDSVDTRNQAQDTIKNAILSIKEHAENTGKTALADLIALLYNNANDYPLWRDSPCNKSLASENVTSVGDGAVFL